jgi:hypothetical protein
VRRLGAWIVCAVLLTGAAAGLGGWAGAHYAQEQARRTSDLDELLHHNLDLSPQQSRRIEALEAAFAGRRRVLDDEMAAANRDLAVALSRDHAMSPDAERAIHRFHDAMGQLQTETVRHVLAMRRELRPDQAQRFDRTVSQALAPAPR